MKVVPDIEARALALRYLDAARRGESESRRLLAEAQKANLEFALRPSDGSKARRAVLARHAYETRLNAELGRTMAAYALLAGREGTRALTAREAMKRVKDAKTREVLVEQAKGGEMRRSIMLQAMEAAAKAFDVAKGLPESVVGTPPGAAQTTIGLTEAFRPKSYLRHAAAFFPLDVRVASGLGDASSAGAEWVGDLTQRLEEDSARIVRRAHELAAQVASQEPGAAALQKEAERLATRLKARYTAEARGRGGFPWLHVVGIVGGLYVLKKLLA